MFASSKSIVAKLVGSNLVASFPNANPPLVWKFDLDRNHSFTVALQGEVGDWEIGVTSPKGEFYPVAHFPAKEDAEEALRKVQKVLMKKKHSKIWMVIRWALVLVLIGLLGFIVMTYFSLRQNTGLGAAGLGLGGIATGQELAAPEPIKPGVPQSADDILQPPP